MKKLYAVVMGILGIGFFASCLEVVNSAVSETDLCWMIPTVLQGTEQKSWPEVVRFIFSAGPPRLAFPGIKAYLFLGLSFLGLHTRDLILFALLIHLANTGLVYGVGYLLGLGRQVAFLSAAVYLSLFAHFHAYLWPTAVAYHLCSAFLILLIFFLYLKVERRITEGRPHRGLFLATLGVGAVASVCRSALIAPLLVFTHLLLEKHAERRISFYRRWSPLFLLSLLMPFYWLVAIPEWHVNSLLRLVIVTLEAIRLPAMVKFLGLLGVGVCALFAVGELLRWSGKGKRRTSWMKWAFLLGAGGGMLFLPLIDRRQILLPYNALVPFAVTLASFLQPTRAALSLDSAYPFYYLRPELEFSDLLLSVLILGLFIVLVVVRQRQLGVLLVWYAATLFHFLFQYSNQPVTAPSRHFVYLSPMFCLVFCSVLVHLGSVFFGGERRARMREVLLLAMVAGFCFENLVAIRLVTWRGRLTNNYYTYDYIRMGRLVQGDLHEKGKGTPSPAALAFEGVVSMPFGSGPWYFIKEVDPEQHRSFRFVLEEVFRDHSMRETKINSTEGSVPTVLYRVLGERFVDGTGRPVDPFDRTFEKAFSELSRGKGEGAGRLFLRAVGQRPFLLNFLLPRECRLEDVRWLTNGLGLRRWLVGMRDTWGRRGTESAKHQHVWKVLEREVLDYQFCLFTLSYLEHRQGREKESCYWLSQIYYLEQDPEVLISQLSKNAVIQKDPALLGFLSSFRDKATFGDPARWRKDDYSFGRFLVRLLLRRDIPSNWDRRLGLALGGTA